MSYLIKYEQPTTEAITCPNCESDDLLLEDNTTVCQNCGDISPVPTDSFYLNHAYLSSCAFGSLDMAWCTDDREKAELMLYKVQQHHPDNLNIVIEEY